MVGPPGFEPGSIAPEATSLDQTSRRPHSDCLYLYLLRLSKSNQRAIVTRVKRLSGIVESLRDSKSVEKEDCLERFTYGIRLKVKLSSFLMAGNFLSILLLLSCRDSRSCDWAVYVLGSSPFVLVSVRSFCSAMKLFLEAYLHYRRKLIRTLLTLKRKNAKFIVYCC